MVRKITFVIVLLFIAAQSKAFQTKVQFINNSGDAALSTVDIYVDNLLFYNDLPFREATMLLDVNANTVINIGIAPGNSLTVNDTVRNVRTTLSDLFYYYAVVNGIKSTTGYSPSAPVSLDIFTGAKANATILTNTEILFHNGSTDGQTMDLRSGVLTIANDIAYKAYSNFYSIASADTKVRTTNTSGSKLLTTYNAPLVSASLTGRAVLILASGFVNPSANSSGPAMGLWMCTTDGGPLQQLGTTSGEAIARCQIIHNCADTTADTVDVYIDGIKKYDDFRFKNTTPFFDIVAKTNIDIAIAPRTSVASTDAFYTLTTSFDSAGKHVLVANGIQSANNYNPKPAFTISKMNNAREDAANSSNTDVAFMNGSTDAGTTDLKEASGTMWHSAVAFGNFGSGYYTAGNSNYMLRSPLLVPSEVFQLNIPTENLAGTAITILACGFKDSTVNSKGSNYWLYYAKPEGGDLVKLPKMTIGISPLTSTENQIQVYPNPACNTLQMATTLNLQSAAILNIQGAVVKRYATITNNIIDISSLTSGQYIIQIQTDHQQINRSFIKQ